MSEAYWIGWLILIGATALALYLETTKRGF